MAATQLKHQCAGVFRGVGDGIRATPDPPTRERALTFVRIAAEKSTEYYKIKDVA
jgi:hypothetical protein